MCTLFVLMILRPPRSPLFPYTTLFRSLQAVPEGHQAGADRAVEGVGDRRVRARSIDARRRVVVRQGGARSEEHTSELQSRQYLVCRLLLEQKNKYINSTFPCSLDMICR